jgi:hypothetical protein
MLGTIDIPGKILSDGVGFLGYSDSLNNPCEKEAWPEFREGPPAGGSGGKKAFPQQRSQPKRRWQAQAWACHFF